MYPNSKDKISSQTSSFGLFLFYTELYKVTSTTVANGILSRSESCKC